MLFIEASPPTFKFRAIPAPPLTTKAPVPVSIDCVLLIRFKKVKYPPLGSIPPLEFIPIEVLYINPPPVSADVVVVTSPLLNVGAFSNITLPNILILLLSNLSKLLS